MFRPEETEPVSYIHLSPEERAALLKKGALVAKPYATAQLSSRGHTYPVDLNEYLIANGQAYARELVIRGRRTLEYLPCSYRR